MLEIFKQLDLFRYRLDKGLCPICSKKPDQSVMNKAEQLEFRCSGLRKNAKIK